MMDLLSQTTRTTPPISFPIPLGTAIPPKVHLGLTVVYIILYGLIFLAAYVQLWMIWYYRHKRFSYQTVFLAFCLVWSGLRATLFSFYFNDCVLANNLSAVPFWALFSLPVCLQFGMLALLLLFFAQVILRASHPDYRRKHRWKVRASISFAVAVFFSLNLACATVDRTERTNVSYNPTDLVRGRVITEDSLFLVFAVAIAWCLFRLSRLPTVPVLLQARGMRVWQAVVASVLLILLFSARAFYNLLALCPFSSAPAFGFDWINVSDQADITDMEEGYRYLTFGVILFLWEILPTATVLLLFRVRRPDVALLDSSEISAHQPTKSFFFDNPRRYDSDDDLSRVHNSHRYFPHRSLQINVPGSLDTLGSRSGSLLGSTSGLSPQDPLISGPPSRRYSSIVLPTGAVVPDVYGNT